MPSLPAPAYFNVVSGYHVFIRQWDAQGCGLVAADLLFSVAGKMGEMNRFKRSLPVLLVTPDASRRVRVLSCFCTSLILSFQSFHTIYLKP